MSIRKNNTALTEDLFNATHPEVELELELELEWLEDFPCLLEAAEEIISLFTCFFRQP
jgi:hypothetical protein